MSSTFVGYPGSFENDGSFVKDRCIGFLVVFV